AISCYGNSILVINSFTGQHISTLRGHHGSVKYSVFSNDASRLVSVGEDTSIIVWDVITSTPLYVLKGHRNKINTLSMNSNSSMVVTSSDDSTAKVWDINQGILKATLKGHIGKVFNAEFSQTGNIILTASHDNSIKIWDTSTLLLRNTMYDVGSQLINAHLTNDGLRAISINLYGKIMIWHTLTGGNLKNISYPEELQLLFIHPNNKEFITTSSNGKVRFWDIYSGVPQYSIFCDNPLNNLSTENFNNSVFTHTTIGINILWDITSKTKIGYLPMPYMSINASLFNSTGKTIYIQSSGTVESWQIDPSITSIKLLENQNSDLMQLYPNPTNMMLTINVKEGYNSSIPTIISIIDNLGNNFYQSEIKHNNVPFECQVNTSDFADGVYYCFVSNGSFNVSKKFTIIH
ncbi:MAG: WD40 repeat domain-containing protein, partial [Candidatus Kapabacteria bacterium]|nr:WD40 repeat domain-containing protein [Candidatus Kapabacteria bacterium]